MKKTMLFQSVQALNTILILSLIFMALLLYTIYRLILDSHSTSKTLAYLLPVIITIQKSDNRQ